MTSFSSIAQSIDNLRFEPIPTRPINVAKAVRTEKVTVFVDVHGRIYSTGVMERVHYTLGSHMSDRVEDTFKCCVKLGLISKEDLKKHKDYTVLQAVKRSRRYAAEAIMDNARELGLKLTQTQERAIKAAKAEGGAA